ncbi:hypothetical protein [Mongoliitalea daihaiensis]|uniref:hypothetical protein n=1 Tax=Mongoliitalea daihaiensis TaxID=2782006 RepID=UPI001F3E675B|nr:hypothetical protein [Mongoliitalea daihaiensis]UJP66229.1 hypothetical protein IPZ59_06310 [Mongoliitalea daihaiensis]
MKISAFLILLILTSCVGTREYRVQSYQVMPFKVVDTSERVFVEFPRELTEKELMTIRPIVLGKLEERDFQEVLCSRYDRARLTMAGIHDFSTQRNYQRLFTDAGIRYLLRVQTWDRRHYDWEFPVMQYAYNAEEDKTYIVRGDLGLEKQYWLTLKYSLYDSKLDKEVAELITTASHPRGRFHKKAIEKDIQQLLALFDNQLK